MTNNSLNQSPVKDVLDRLHKLADKQFPQLVKLFIRNKFNNLINKQRPTTEVLAHKLKDLFIPLDRKQGLLMYLTARSKNAKYIVEFGTSFGISTIYLAAAVKDNGGGKVIGSEIEPGKIKKAREHIKQAGLEEYVEIREGDALETLKDHDREIDLVLIDGWKDLYLPVLKILKPHLKQGAPIFADNIYTFKKDLADYVHYVQSGENGFHSLTMPFKDGFEYSIKL